MKCPLSNFHNPGTSSSLVPGRDLITVTQQQISSNVKPYCKASITVYLVTVYPAVVEAQVYSNVWMFSYFKAFALCSAA